MNKHENKYYENPKHCLECGKILPYNKKSNKFCNSSCSATYINKHRKHSQKTKDKISETLKSRKVDSKIEFCKYCGKEFILKRTKSGRFSKEKYCCKDCHDKSIKEIHHNLRIKEIQDGTFIGWKSRNVISYAEKFFIEVLNNNNIKYEKEYSLHREHKQSYFLDFYIEKNGIKIDLEIDGKQHKYEDRKRNDILRDQFIFKQDIKVYRIDWNEINSVKGKQLMKEKINKFLDFYRAL